MGSKALALFFVYPFATAASGVNAMVSLPLAPLQLAIFPSLSMSLTQIALVGG